LHAVDGAPVTPRSAVTTVTITVERNLVNPQFSPLPTTSPNSYVFNVEETRQVGFVVGEVAAVDTDPRVGLSMYLLHHYKSN